MTEVRDPAEGSTQAAEHAKYDFTRQNDRLAYIKDVILIRAEGNELTTLNDVHQQAPAESTLHKIGRYAAKILGGFLLAAGAVAAVVACCSFGTLLPLP